MDEAKQDASDTLTFAATISTLLGQRGASHGGWVEIVAQLIVALTPRVYNIFVFGFIPFYFCCVLIIHYHYHQQGSHGQKTKSARRCGRHC